MLSSAEALNSILRLVKFVLNYCKRLVQPYGQQTKKSQIIHLKLVESYFYSTEYRPASFLQRGLFFL